IRPAVSVVTCRQAPMRTPSSGFSFSKRSRMALSTGMCMSAHSMRSTPWAARPISLMSWSEAKRPSPFVVIVRSRDPAGGQRETVVRSYDGGRDQGVGDDEDARLTECPGLERREPPGVGNARHDDAGRVYPSPAAGTNDGGLIYARERREGARHGGRPAAAERAAQLQVHVVGDGEERARGEPDRRGEAARGDRHDETDAAPRRLFAEEREQTTFERGGRTKVLPRQKAVLGSREQLLAGASRGRLVGGQYERDGAARHPFRRRRRRRAWP